jgi:hypothetical protein
VKHLFFAHQHWRFGSEKVWNMGCYHMLPTKKGYIRWY